MRELRAAIEATNPTIRLANGAVDPTLGSLIDLSGGARHFYPYGNAVIGGATLGPYEANRYTSGGTYTGGFKLPEARFELAHEGVPENDGDFTYLMLFDWYSPAIPEISQSGGPLTLYLFEMHGRFPGGTGLLQLNAGVAIDRVQTQFAPLAVQWTSYLSYFYRTSEDGGIPTQRKALLPVPAQNTLHFLVVRRKRGASSSDVRACLNGAWYSAEPAGNDFPVLEADCPVYLGSGFGLSPDAHFAEFAFWDYALTDGQVATLYAAWLAESDPVPMTLSGAVYLDGVPIAGAVLHLLESTTGEWRGTTVTSGLGGYAFQDSFGTMLRGGETYYVVCREPTAGVQPLCQGPLTPRVGDFMMPP